MVCPHNHVSEIGRQAPQETRNWARFVSREMSGEVAKSKGAARCWTSLARPLCCAREKGSAYLELLNHPRGAHGQVNVEGRDISKLTPTLPARFNCPTSLCVVLPCACSSPPGPGRIDALRREIHTLHTYTANEEPALLLPCTRGKEAQSSRRQKAFG